MVQMEVEPGAPIHAERLMIHTMSERLVRASPRRRTCTDTWT